MDLVTIRAEIEILKALATTKKTPAEFAARPSEWESFLWLINMHVEKIEAEILKQS